MRNCKRLVVTILVLGLLATAAMAYDHTAQPMGSPTMPLIRPWIALLTSTQQVPPGNAPAIGHVHFMLSADGMALNYTLGVEGIMDPTAAHIHLGLPNQNGPIVANLFTGTMPDGYMDNMWPGNHWYGDLAMGTITAKDLVGPLAGKPLACLLALMHSNDAYVNVHTKTMPDGEIRGQIH